jgi:hypothetical protein
MKQVFYKGSVLSKNSTALELWESWQKETKDRNQAQKKLDDHMKVVNQKSTPMPEHLVGYAVGAHPEDWK